MESNTGSPGPGPRPKYLGDGGTHPIEHGEDVDQAAREESLVGTSAHQPPEDLRNEEPSRETSGSTESGE